MYVCMYVCIYLSIYLYTMLKTMLSCYIFGLILLRIESIDLGEPKYDWTNKIWHHNIWEPQWPMRTPEKTVFLRIKSSRISEWLRNNSCHTSVHPTWRRKWLQSDWSSNLKTLVLIGFIETAFIAVFAVFYAQTYYNSSDKFNYQEVDTSNARSSLAWKIILEGIKK